MKIVNELAALRLLEAITRRARQDLTARRVAPGDKQSALDYLDLFLSGGKYMSGFYNAFEDKFFGRAKEIDARYGAEKRRIGEDATLSQTGKAQALERAQQQRANAVAILQGEARKWLQNEHLQAAADAAYHRAQAVEERRRTLGNEVLATVYERRLATMTPAQIAQEYRDSAPGFERAVVQEFGRLALLARLDAGDGAAKAQALEALTALDGEPNQDLLRAQETARLLERNLGPMVERLDLDAYRAQTAVALGVRADLLDIELSA